MPISLPDLPDPLYTPLVRQLLDMIGLRKERIQQREDDMIRLKGLKTRSQIAPSPLETPPRPRPTLDSDANRPGSAHRPMSVQVSITHGVVIPLPEVPPGAIYAGFDDFVDLNLGPQPKVSRYCLAWEIEENCPGRDRNGA
jgi:hypothetical protein